MACHPGHADKCAAVRRDFGSFAGCDADFCLEGLLGAAVEGCGHGARVGRGVIELVGGGRLTLVNVHGSSGLTHKDMDCREAQFRQVFEDLGDGQPATSGALNLVMGDFNTDPGRWDSYDHSAAYLATAGSAVPFHFVSALGPEAAPTYQGIANIDHVISDGLGGDCVSPGVTEGEPAVSDIVFFDHHPVVCGLSQE